MVSSVAPSLLVKQLLAWIIGLIFFIFGTQLNPKSLKNKQLIIFIICCLLLSVPLLMNTFTRGSRRWIDIGFTTIQPSEIIKPLLLLFLINTKYHFLAAIPILMTLIQPDLGSAITLSLLLTPFLIYEKYLQKLAILGFISFLVFSPLIWKYVLKDYQRNRIINFINPNHDPLNQGYNVIQSKIAIGSGGFWGKGYKKGSQSQLFFLPEKHTDFMFAAIGEERGVVGITTIIGCYLVIIISLIAKAYDTTQNRPMFLFTLALVFQIWIQSFINIGMNLGVMPVTGIPLPFLSVGGSSLIALLLSLGIIFSI